MEWRLPYPGSVASRSKPLPLSTMATVTVDVRRSVSAVSRARVVPAWLATLASASALACRNASTTSGGSVSARFVKWYSTRSPCEALSLLASMSARDRSARGPSGWSGVAQRSMLALMATLRGRAGDRRGVDESTAHRVGHHRRGERELRLLRHHQR